MMNPFRSLISLCFLLVLLSIFINVGNSLYSNETCFDNGDCFDLTTFVGTNKSRTMFWPKCQYYFLNIYGYTCEYQWGLFNNWVLKSPQVSQFQYNVDVFALWAYTRFYKEVNNGLRDQGPHKHVDSDFEWLDVQIGAGLTAIKHIGGSYTKLAWRSESDSIQDYHTGHGYRCLFYMSTSYDRSFAWNWGHANKDVFIVVANSGGRDINNISPWPNQYEVLLAAGFNYHILLIKNITNAWFMQAKQVFMYQIDNNTVHYTPKQQSDLLQYMIKQDKLHEENGTNLLQSQIKYIAKRNNERKINNRIIPDSWSCERDWYNSNDGCDCECGARDPDCDNATVVLNCVEGPSPECDSVTNMCKYSYDKKLLNGWICDKRHYNTSDGCDCGCGILDPDCIGISGGAPILTNCRNDEEFNTDPIGCTAEGNCLYAPEVPPDWTCEDRYYGRNDGCDCNCGTLDPDCLDESSYDITFNCPCEGMTCTMSGKCDGYCDNDDEYIIGDAIISDE